MKKWKIWSPIVLVIMAIAGGSFAYTYLTATQQISVSGAGGDIATVEAVGSPSWPNMVGKKAGTLPTTTLFRIDPLDGYTGNFLISVYLTNAGELAYCYQHLNMKMEIFDGSDAKVGRTEVLTLKNAVITFEMGYGTGWVKPYYVRITGGSYNTLKGTAGSGESFAPAFYCEASQR